MAEINSNTLDRYLIVITEVILFLNEIVVEFSAS